MSQRAHVSIAARLRGVRLGPWLRLLLPIALHIGLFALVFQMGFTREQVHALVGPRHRLIEPYVAAARELGPVGVLRIYFHVESDERLYYEYARLLWSGRADLEHIRHVQRTVDAPEAARAVPERAWPYRDVRVEYPPLAFLAFAPPALVASDYETYRPLVALWFLALHLANLALAALLLCERDPAAPPRPSTALTLRASERLLWLSLAFCVLLGRLVATRMDHLVVTWTLLALLAAARGSNAQGRARLGWAAAAGLLAALGVMTKLVPGLALAACVCVWLGSNARDRVRMSVCACATAGVALALLNLAMFALAGPRYLETFTFHGLRGVQIESSWGGLILIAQGFGATVRAVKSYGSVNLESAATTLVKLVSPLTFVALCAVLGLRRWPSRTVSLLTLTLALLLVFILTNRVLSPQYLIWIGPPLLALGVFHREFRAPCALLLACAFASQLIYPHGYPVLKAFHPLAIGLLNLRNLGLAWLTWQLVRSARRPAAPGAEAS